MIIPSYREELISQIPAARAAHRTRLPISHARAGSAIARRARTQRPAH